MRFISKLAFFLTALTWASAGNIDDDIKEIFTSPKPEAERSSTGENASIREGSQTKYCDGGYGECVPYYLCAKNELVTDGTGIIDIRFQEDNPCSYLEVCCGKKNNGESNHNTPIPPPDQHPPSCGGHCGTIVDKPITPPPKTYNGCGYRNENGIGFKITGNSDNEAEYAEFPWMVAILKEETVLDKQLNVYQCGGSLITPKVVLSAAHCVHIYKAEPHKLKVRAGEWDTQTKNEIFEHQDRNVYDVVIHEAYYKGGLHNDVALLFLSDPIDMTNDNVGVVCLPRQDFNFDFANCFASGWGKDTFGRDGKYQVILKKIELPVVPNVECERALRSTRLTYRFNLHDSFICAGGVPGKDTCKGDGGSPLVCPIPGLQGRYYQAGIVAWGIGCGETGVPGVYASVAKFRDWIDHQVETRNIDKNHYQEST